MKEKLMKALELSGEQQEMNVSKMSGMKAVDHSVEQIKVTSVDIKPLKAVEIIYHVPVAL